MRPNHALQRTRPSRPGCNRTPLRAGSLSLGRSAHPSHRPSHEPPPLRPQRLRPVPEGPQNRSINRPHVSPPIADPIWLDVARSAARGA